jgi:hypothetical protein
MHRPPPHKSSHPASESSQRPHVFRGVVVGAGSIGPADAVREVFGFPLHEHVHWGVNVAHADLVADRHEWLERHHLAALLQIQEHGEESLVQSGRESLVVDEHDVGLLQDLANTSVGREISTQKMHFAHVQAPKLRASWELFGLQFCEVARVVHHLDTPTFRSDFKRGLQDDVAHAGPEVHEDLFVVQSRPLQNLADKVGEQLAIDIIAAVLVLFEIVDPWGYRPAVRLLQDALHQRKREVGFADQFAVNRAILKQRFDKLVEIVHRILEVFNTFTTPRPLEQAVEALLVLWIRRLPPEIVREVELADVLDRLANVFHGFVIHVGLWPFQLEPLHGRIARVLQRHGCRLFPSKDIPVLLLLASGSEAVAMHELERFAVLSYSLRRECPLRPCAFHGAHAALNALARSVRVAAPNLAAPVIVIVVAE